MPLFGVMPLPVCVLGHSCLGGGIILYPWRSTQHCW